MRKLAVLLTTIGLAATASIARADTAQLELLPSVGGIEMTQYVREEGASAVAANSSDASFYAHTGGVPPQ